HVPVPDPTETAFGRRPDRAVPPGSEIVHAARAQPIRFAVGTNDPAVLEIADAPVKEAEPQAAARRRIRQRGGSPDVLLELGPRELLNSIRSRPTKKTQVHEAEPCSSMTIWNGGHGPHDSARQARNPDESVSLQVEHPFRGRDPQAMVVIQCQPVGNTVEHGIGSSRRGTSLVPERAFLPAVKGDVAVLPSVQAVGRADPDASIRGSQHRPGIGAGEPLERGDARECICAKAVESPCRADPDTAFAVLVDSDDALAGETVPDTEEVGPPLVQTQQAVMGRNPKAAIAAPEEAIGPRYGR